MIRFAVVGQGHIGKRHAEMIRRNKDSELVAVCDILPKEQLGLENIEVPFFNSIDDLFNSGLQFDVVNICTPNGFHAEHAIKALEHKYHVVLEKPIALTKHDAEQIVFKSLEVSRHVFCVMQNRYSQPSMLLKDLVSKKILGDIFMVQVNCFWNRDERYYTSGSWHGTKNLDGGTLFTQFSHFIDTLYWLFGDITNIQSKFNNFSHQSTIEFEDSGIITFDFVSGGMGTLSYSTAIWNKNLESSITIIGSKGSIKVSGQYMDTIEYCHIKDYEMPKLAPSNPPNDYGAYKGSTQNHHYVIQNVVEKIQDTSCIATNVLEALKVIDIIEQIYQVRDTQWKKNKK